MPMLNPSAISHETLVGKALRFPLRMVPRDIMVPILQGPLRGKRWMFGSARHSCWLGTYELEKQLAFAKNVRSGDIVYDLGANVGYYSLLASVLVGERGHVHSFEPFASNVDVIQKHIKANRIKNCTVHACAVSDLSGFAVFEVSATSHTMGHLSDTVGERVEVVSLDELVGNGLEPPTVIKCDIEGAEYKMMCGAKNVIATSKPIVFLATHNTTVRRQCNDFLIDLGYKLESLDESKPVGESDEVLATAR